MPRAARSLLLICSAAGTLTVGACGGSGDDSRMQSIAAPEGKVDTILASTFGSSAEGPDSGRLSLRMAVRGGSGPPAALRGPLDVRMSGPFDLSRTDEVPRFDVETVVDTGRRTVRSGAVSTGEEGYVRLRGRVYELAPALYEQIAEVLLGGAGEGGKLTMRSLRIDPRRWLLDARRGADEQAAGAQAIHVTGHLNVPRLLNDLDMILGQAGQLGLMTAGAGPRGLGPDARERLAGEVSSASADIWTGTQDRILRRLDVRLALRSGGSLRLQLALREVDEPQRIAAPAGARPFSELLSSKRVELERSMASTP